MSERKRDKEGAGEGEGGREGERTSERASERERRKFQTVSIVIGENSTYKFT